MRIVLGAILAAALLAGCSHASRTAAPAGPTSPASTAPSPGATASAPSPPVGSSAPVPLPPSVAPNSGSGITGVTLLIGGCPVPMDKPCPERPVSVPLNLLDTRTNQVAAKVTSGRDGTFRVAVGPGRYLVSSAAPTGPLSRPLPVTVDVRDGAYTPVVVRFMASID
jgi:hypothetical protein